jgi:hypothetical protein
MTIDVRGNDTGQCIVLEVCSFLAGQKVLSINGTHRIKTAIVDPKFENSTDPVYSNPQIRSISFYDLL